MPSLVETIKQVALSVVKESKPVGVDYGTVESISPLKIKLDQKRTLTDTFLVLTRTAREGLKLNSKVVLLRVQGGQKYVVLDRM